MRTLDIAALLGEHTVRYTLGRPPPILPGKNRPLSGGVALFGLVCAPALIGNADGGGDGQRCGAEQQAVTSLCVWE